ncbi:MAG: hypothetical protein AB8A43_03460 [Prochlorococcus sp.]|jgi:hypothetical protein|nr:hypothetical protein [Prochlorococcaceae cyanobacterium ETNP14_MAG_5]
MNNSVVEPLGNLQPVVTPRVERLRQQISIKELEQSLARLGFPVTIPTELVERIAS